MEQSIGIPADRIVLGELSLCYYMLMRDEDGRKKQASNKAKQHNTPKAVTFPKKNELPRVGFMTCKYVWLVMTLSYILS